MTAKNPRLKIFHESNADNKLSVLLSIQKYNPTYSELLKKVTFKASALKPLLEELLKNDYIAIDLNSRYMCKRPLPSPNDIKVYRYILRHNPKHSKMLRSVKDIDARHITAILSKLQREGLLHYDIKTERYSIIIENDDVIGTIMDTIDTEVRIAEFIQKFRENFRKYDLSDWYAQKVFISTFFDFTILEEHNLDLVSWLDRHGCSGLLDMFEYDELYAEIVERGKKHPSPFWQTIDKYLCILNDNYSHNIVTALKDDIDNMSEEYIQGTISQLPTFRSKDDFLKALEQKLFDGYKYLLTVKTSYLDMNDGRSYHQTLNKALEKYYLLAYPENVLVELYREALNGFKDFKMYKNKDDAVLFEEFCNNQLLEGMGMLMRRNGYDFDTLSELIISNKRTYSGKVSKRMKECLQFVIQQHPDDAFTKLLKLVFAKHLEPV